MYVYITLVLICTCNFYRKRFSLR